MTDKLTSTPIMDYNTNSTGGLVNYTNETPTSTTFTTTYSPELTFGQQLVGISFNPSKLHKVDSIKNYFADLIDSIYAQQKKEVEDAFASALAEEEHKFNEVKSAIAGQAINALTDACMWAVKYETSK